MKTGFSLCCGLNRSVYHTGLYIRRSHFSSSNFTSISRKTYASGSVHPWQYLLFRQKKNLYKANHTAALMNMQESFHSNVNWQFWHFMNKNWEKCYLLIDCCNTFQFHWFCFDSGMWPFLIDLPYLSAKVRHVYWVAWKLNCPKVWQCTLFGVSITRQGFILTSCLMILEIWCNISYI